MQGRGQAVQKELPGEAKAVTPQAVHAPGFAQLRGLALCQHPVQEGMGRLRCRPCVPLGEGWEPAAGGRVVLPQIVAGDGAVVQGLHRQCAIRSLPPEAPDAGQAVLIAVSLEQVIARGVQGQGVLDRLSHPGQGRVGGLLRGRRRQGQPKRNGQGQHERKQLLHHSSLHCGAVSGYYCPHSI